MGDRSYVWYGSVHTGMLLCGLHFPTFGQYYNAMLRWNIFYQHIAKNTLIFLSLVLVWTKNISSTGIWFNVSCFLPSGIFTPLGENELTGPCVDNAGFNTPHTDQWINPSINQSVSFRVDIRQWWFWSGPSVSIDLCSLYTHKDFTCPNVSGLTHKMMLYELWRISYVFKYCAYIHSVHSFNATSLG